MRQTSFVALLLCVSACSRPHSFGGEYTSAVAFFQALVPSSVSVFLFGDETVTCELWQQYPYSGDYVELGVGGITVGQYDVQAPSPASGLDLGKADALAYLGSDSVQSTGGSMTLSQISIGQTLTASGHVDWNDGESVIIDQFSATYCPAVPAPTSFQGTLTPQAAFFDNGAGTAGEAGLSLFVLSQTLDCNSWQQTTPPISSNTLILEVDVYATADGSYSIVEAANPGKQTATALISQGTGQAASSMDAASGRITVSAINPNDTVAASDLQITWNDNTTLQVGAFTATYCPLSN